MFCSPLMRQESSSTLRRCSRGFSLIETVVVMLIFTLAMGGLAELYYKCLSSEANLGVDRELRKNIQAVSDEFTRHIREASSVTGSNDNLTIVVQAQGGLTYTYIYWVNANRQLMRTINGNPAGGEPVLDARNLGNPDPGAGIVPVTPGFTPRPPFGAGRIVIDIVASRRNADGQRTWTQIESRVIAYTKEAP